MYVGYIYRHWIINEKHIEKNYIGQVYSQKRTPEKRWKHDGSGYKPTNDKNTRKFWNAIKKYGWNNFQHEILLIIECEIEEELWFWLDEWECYYIEKYDSYYNGYNSTLGGKGVRGWEGMKGNKNPMYGTHWTKERKIEQGKKYSGKNHPLYGKKGPMNGKTQTDETKKKISKALKEKPKTEQHRKNLSSSRKGKYSGSKHPMYGKKQTEESKRKNSLSHQGKATRHRKVICIETGEVFNTIKEAQEWCKGNIDQYLRGRSKSAGKHPVTGEKLHWMYYEKE